MKAPISKRIQKILADKEGAKELTAAIKGERNGSHSFSYGGKVFSLERIFTR